MTEIRVARARGDDEKIIMQLAPVVAPDDSRVGDDLARLGEQDFGVPLRVQQPADRRRDVGRRERRRRDLIQQRLEDVMIRPIDHRDVYGGIAQGACGVQSTKSATDDDNLGQAHARQITRRENILPSRGACLPPFPRRVGE